jgi:hypothetical protein
MWQMIAAKRRITATWAIFDPRRQAERRIGCRTGQRLHEGASQCAAGEWHRWLWVVCRVRERAVVAKG